MCSERHRKKVPESGILKVDAAVLSLLASEGFQGLRCLACG
jgi:hypothetical protein